MQLTNFAYVYGKYGQRLVETLDYLAENSLNYCRDMGLQTYVARLNESRGCPISISQWLDGCGCGGRLSTCPRRSIRGWG